MIKKLLILSNLPTKNTEVLLSETQKGAKSIQSNNIKILACDAREVNHNHILDSAGIIIGTTENLGYMSGVVKDFFDRNYNHCIDKTNGLPYAIYIRAGHDGTGTEINIKRIIREFNFKPKNDLINLLNHLVVNYKNNVLK